MQLTVKRLEAYIRLACFQGKFCFIKSNSQVEILELKKIGGGIRSSVYSFVLINEYGCKKYAFPLVLKIYTRSIHPILNIDLNEQSVLCTHEFEVMKYLGNVGFAVPTVYLFEINSSFLGAPFIIMHKEESIAKSICDLENFAKTLAALHNLKIAESVVKLLKSPSDELSYARYWQAHLRQLFEAGKQSAPIKRYYEVALLWINSKVTSIHCPQYSLLHGDYHLGNTILTENSTLKVIDWEGATIGDPVCDVGYAYHFINFFYDKENPNSRGEIAERFISAYQKSFHGDISSRLEFYQIVGCLRVAMYLNATYSNPYRLYQYYGPRGLIAFPLTRCPPAAKFLISTGEISRLKYLERFLKERLVR